MKNPTLWLRVALALIFVSHATHRTLSGGVWGFGEFLNNQGFPLGKALAWGVTSYEYLGSLLLLLAPLAVRRVAAAVFVVHQVMGIALVHFKEGWFVVGSGRNGWEFSFLIIVCLLVVAKK